MGLTEDIIAVLDEIQNGLYKYQKSLKSMRTLHDQHGFDAFFQAFFTPFANVLLVYKREPAVERVVDFVCKFAIAVGTKTEDNDADESSSCDDNGETVDFPNLLILKLVGYHQAKDKAVRFRVCQIINKMLSLAAHEKVRILCIDPLLTVMLQRAYDKIPAVRVQAVQALGRFQTIEDKECPAVGALLNIVRGDSSADVRKSALQAISVFDRTLPVLLECVRDVKDSVRLAAFVLLSETCSIMNLTIGQRIYLLEAGLNDRNDLVQDACVSGLLKNWCLQLDSDFMRLLHRLDVESSPELAEKALFKLFDSLYSNECLVKILREFMEEGQPGLQEDGQQTTGEGLGETAASPITSSVEAEMDRADQVTTDQTNVKSSRVVKCEALNCDLAFFWSCMCRYFSKKGPEGEIQLEKIVPTLSEYCEYVQKYVTGVFLKQEEMHSRLQSQFVTQQLFSMFEVLDFSDEVGRRRLAKLVYDLTMMPNFPSGLVGPLLARQADIWPQETYRIEKLTELIADLRQPPIVEGSDVRHQPLAPDCTQMSEFNISLLDLRSDSSTLIKCLVIAAEMLRETKMKRLNPTLLTLLDTLVLPCVQNEDPFVRDLAFNCLGLAAILDVSLAQKYLLLFLQVSQVDHELLQATALKIVFDLIHLFGFEAYAAPNHQGGDGEGVTLDDHPLDGDVNPGEPIEEAISKFDDLESEGHNKTTQKIVGILADFLDGESQLLCSIAAEGLAKLFISGRIMSQKLLARLLLLWYSPNCEDDDHLRGVLGVFFPIFAAGKRSQRESLGEIFTQVLEMILEAEPGTPYAGINTANVVDFLLQLTKPVQNEDSVHDGLAVTVGNKILADPADVVTVRLYCRALSLMEFTPTNKSGTSDLQLLLDRLVHHVVDKTSLRYLKKLDATLQKINPTQATQASIGGSSPHAENSERPSEEQENIPIAGEEPQAPVSTKNVKKTARKTKGKGAPLTSRQEVDVVVTNQQACELEQRQEPPSLTVKPRVAKAPAAKKAAKAGKGKGKSGKAKPVEDNLKDDETEQRLGLCLDEQHDDTLVATPPTVVRKVTRGNRIKGRGTDSHVLSPEVQNPAPDKKAGSKKSAKQQVATDDDESDDSLLGEDSPFVKQQATRTRQTAPPPRFECSDQES